MASPYHNTISSPLLPIIIILCIAPHLPHSISAVDRDHNHDHLLSPSTFLNDYQTMLSTFRIFPYTLPFNRTDATSPFHSSLLSSPFVTAVPAVAHLFYLPTPPDLPARSLERVISHIRSSLPFWNRSLAADHFFLSSCSRAASAAPTAAARNVVELRKNAVRVAGCFPAPAGFFIPHKDVSLPPPPLTGRFSPNRTRSGQNYKYLGVFMGPTPVRSGAGLIDGLRSDPEFMIGSRPLDDVEASRFCLFWYGGEVVGLGEALARGCLPVMIADRPIQDMPLMDVLRWQEIALFVGSGVRPAGLKRLLNEVLVGGRYERMKRSGVAAAHHFAWNDPPKPYDAFHMVVYQLWLRRHVVRYATSDTM